MTQAPFNITTASRTMTTKVLNINTINPLLIDMKYAVRGLVPTTAGKIAKELKTNPSKFPFKEILYCNIGNPQSVGQKPITWYRNVMALVDAPHLLEKPEVHAIFPVDVITRAKKILKELPQGTGAYSNSVGAECFVQDVARFIEKRDGYSVDPEKIVLTNGASSGIDLVLTSIISNPNVGVLIPIPQYPIYSALIKILNGTQLNYNLIEDEGWALDIDQIKKTVSDARLKGITPRVMVIINPGNPTGSILRYEQLVDLVKFCKKEGLIILADEVYQENIYDSNQKFTSVKKVVRDLGPEYDDFEFVSFHSTSKGLIGECGRRGGYMELCGFDEIAVSQIFKLQSSRLCSNLDGQVMTSLMVNPPQELDESYESYTEERDSIFKALQRKSVIVYNELNSIEGITCQPITGAMYAFPKITIPEGAIQAAKAEGIAADTFYSLSLLNNTGICVVPGSGFGQEEGTYHIRITFLPEEGKLLEAMKDFKKHHEFFLQKYCGSNL